MRNKANKQYGTHRFWIGKEALEAAKVRKELQMLTKAPMEALKTLRGEEKPVQERTLCTVQKWGNKNITR